MVTWRLIVRRGDLVVKNRLRLPKSRTYTRLCHRANVFCVRRAIPSVVRKLRQQLLVFFLNFARKATTRKNSSSPTLRRGIEDYILGEKREDHVYFEVYSIKSAIFSHSRNITFLNSGRSCVRREISLDPSSLTCHFTGETTILRRS